MRTLGILTISAILFAPAWAEVEQNSKETRTFPGTKRIVIDNVWGSIEVSGTATSGTTVDIAKSIHAESDERAAAAARDVKLTVDQSGDTLRLYVDGPFRCHCEEGGRGVHNWHHSGYHVVYDFKLSVAAGTDVELYTVNDGHIKVDHVNGTFDVEDVNGAIDLIDIGGTGRARTVNGAVKASFTRNPTGIGSFETLNGNVDLTFLPGLSADVHASTQNGGVYSDYEVKALPVKASTERRDGKFILRANTGVRIGNGGLDLTLKTLNGNIFVREKQ